jgi:hypothetical protein
VLWFESDLCLMLNEIKYKSMQVEMQREISARIRPSLS